MTSERGINTTQTERLRTWTTVQRRRCLQLVCLQRESPLNYRKLVSICVHPLPHVHPTPKLAKIRGVISPTLCHGCLSFSLVEQSMSSIEKEKAALREKNKGNEVRMMQFH